ncbi:MAG TPA: TetR/AcrR family transcriptional regulator [Caulobacteraceae bacterium]|jgi:AcrR family transcriptional regulator|nr:TetR/AcrR family transcriptional regulator [Caulobacteraceae bacterium]
MALLTSSTPLDLLLTERRRKPTDLTVRDWLEAGQALLKEGGLRALKLRPLADALGVSTGSFYHHFVDFPAYQAALADYFSGDQIRRVLAEADEGADPLGRIERLVGIVVREGLSQLGLAMRAWAESDVRARAAVQGQDAAVLAFLTENLRGLGFAETEARVRAYALVAVAVGLGVMHGANGLSPAELKHGLFDLLCAPERNPISKR